MHKNSLQAQSNKHSKPSVEETYSKDRDRLNKRIPTNIRRPQCYTSLQCQLFRFITRPSYRPHYLLARPSVRPSVCPVRAPNSKTNIVEKVKIGTDIPRARISAFLGDKVKGQGHKRSQTSTAIWRHVYLLLLRRRLRGGRGLEFPSVTQPVATGRTVAYHEGADICVCCRRRAPEGRRHIMSKAVITIAIQLRYDYDVSRAPVSIRRDSTRAKN